MYQISLDLKNDCHTFVLVNSFEIFFFKITITLINTYTLILVTFNIIHYFTKKCKLYQCFCEIQNSNLVDFFFYMFF